MSKDVGLWFDSKKWNYTSKPVTIRSIDLRVLPMYFFSMFTLSWIVFLICIGLTIFFVFISKRGHTLLTVYRMFLVFLAGKRKFGMNPRRIHRFRY